MLQVIITDVTEVSEGTNHRNKCPRYYKTLLANFKDQKLPLFAKRCVREAICLVNMFPEDSLFAWETFHCEIGQLVADSEGEELLEALAAIRPHAHTRNELVRFVCPYLSILSPVSHTCIRDELRVRCSPFRHQ